MPTHPGPESPPAGGILSDAAEILRLGTPADEFRRLVRARMETLAKLDSAGVAPDPAATPGAGAQSRLELYADAMALGLEALEECRE